MLCYRPKIEIRSRVVTPNSALVVSLADFKQFIRWGADTSEDTTMTTCLKVATMQAESFTGRTISVAPWISTLPYFASVFMDVLPVSSIVVKYDDVDGNPQTLSSAEYTVIDNPDEYSEIRFDGTLPTLESDNYEPVRIEYNAGYSTLPDGLKLGIMQLAASYFENRQNEVIGTSSNLISHSSLHTLYPYKML